MRTKYRPFKDWEPQKPYPIDISRAHTYTAPIWKHPSPVVKRQAYILSNLPLHGFAVAGYSSKERIFYIHWKD